MSHTWRDHLQKQQTRYVEELVEFLKIPSISSAPEHLHDIQEAARWVRSRLAKAGLENLRILPAGKHAVVYGDWLHAPGKPTVLIYGHFDTQPVDPLELWDAPPFEPVIRDNRVYARGASDDKGNMLAPILALEAHIHSSGGLPVNIKVLFEGQEEIGSPDIPTLMAEHGSMFACDFVLSADGGHWQEGVPSIPMGMRGLCALELTVTGPDHDLHSGAYGGAIPNAIHGLVELLASMRDREGNVLVAGFYDGVRTLSDEEWASLANVPFDQQGFASKVGASSLIGSEDFHPLERVWTRPTLEVNGIGGGFQGEGIKTVLPSKAHAKISCRLAPYQQPEQVLERLEAHIAAHTPKGMRVSVTREASSALPYLVPQDHIGLQAVTSVLTALYGKAPIAVYAGGSIPICGLFLQHLGVPTIGFSFGLPDERGHSPNEFFRLESFERAQLGYGMMLDHLATL